MDVGFVRLEGVRVVPNGGGVRLSLYLLPSCSYSAHSTILCAIHA